MSHPIRPAAQPHPHRKPRGAQPGGLDRARRLPRLLPTRRPGDRYVAYQERRARGGAGLIILQPMHVHPTSHALGHYAYDPADLRPKLGGWTTPCTGTAPGVGRSCIHFGAEFHSDARDDLQPLWSFGGIPLRRRARSSHRMTSDEIEDGGRRVRAHGGPGRRVRPRRRRAHAAHGYLLQQSFSPVGQQTGPTSGASLCASSPRCSSAVRAGVGPTPVVGLRISADDWLPPGRGGLGAERTPAGGRRPRGHGGARLPEPLRGRPRRPLRPRRRVSYRHPLGEFLPLTAGCERRSTGPCRSSASAGSPRPTWPSEALAGGTCDLIAMTRAQIADPDLVAKLRPGERRGSGPAWGPTRVASTG